LPTPRNFEVFTSETREAGGEGKTMTIRVVRDQQAPMRHEIRIGQNSIFTDLANELGGEGTGPSPHDLYDAALGAGTYRLSTALTLTGDLSAAQREELVRVAHKCPIQRLMTEVRTEISTSLVACSSKV
jgi:putative redox protein